jgi:predicted dinucleotide-binding enzyme
MKIGIIGAGRVGVAVGRQLISAALAARKP